jgi:MFS superfamily sulfate permease-like transporter
MNYISIILSLLNVAPGWKTKIAAIAAFLLAIVSAWNSLAPQIGSDLIVHIPDFVNAAVLALLGVGAANQPANLPKQ